MDWKDWQPHYFRIAEDLGIDISGDMESARLLDELMGSRDFAISGLDDLLHAKDVAVFGPAQDSRPLTEDCVIIAAGSVTSALSGRGIEPHLIVTDLDGDVDAQLAACRSGALAVIHAHGDNMKALKEWVPRFPPRVIGTTQAEPFGRIRNFGGFTDGDRAVFLAAHFGARHILLRGFDFDNPAVKQGTDPARKRKKLAHAKRLVNLAAGLYGNIEM